MNLLRGALHLKGLRITGLSYESKWINIQKELLALDSLGFNENILPGGVANSDRYKLTDFIDSDVSLALQA